NILLHEGRAVVADFGIAMPCALASNHRITQPGTVLGTPEYMSPEQALGNGAIDGRADIYALGAVTYEMLVGRPPFTGATLPAITARILAERPHGIRAQRPEVSAAVESAVLAALERSPDDRFASAAELGAALEYELFADFRRRTDPLSRPRRGVRAAGVAALALAASALGYWGRGVRSAEGAPLTTARHAVQSSAACVRDSLELSWRLVGPPAQSRQAGPKLAAAVPEEPEVRTTPAGQP